MSQETQVRHMDVISLEGTITKNLQDRLIGLLIWMPNMPGNFVNWYDARLHPGIHAIHYGTSAIEGIKARKVEGGSAVLELDEHIERLFNSIKVGYYASDEQIKVSQQQMARSVIDVLVLNKLEEAYIRPVLYFDNLGWMPGNPDANPPVQGNYLGFMLNGRLIPVNAFTIAVPFKYIGTNVKATVVQTTRGSPTSMPPQAKVGSNYGPSVRGTTEAKIAGFDDAIQLDSRGQYVAEAPGANIFIYDGNKLVTPSEGNMLPGLTRRSVMELAATLGITVDQRQITQQEMMDIAVEAFYAGTAAGIADIRKIDGKELKRDFSLHMQEMFENYARGRHELSAGRLTRYRVI